MKEKIQRITIKGMVCEDDKIFMVKDTSGNWEFPGGRIDWGEHLDQTIRREFIEELGVENVTLGQFIYIWDFISEKIEQEFHFVVVMFECFADLSTIKMSDEHQEYKWIELNDIDKYQMREGYRDSIKKFRQAKGI